MDKNILSFLKNYSYDACDVNRLIVSSFLLYNEVKSVKNKLIKSYIIDESSEKEFEELNRFLSLIKRYSFAFELEDLIEIFEFVISPAHKKVNGAVFTPEFIRKYIVNNAIREQIVKGKNLLHLKFGDIACGCGGFFKTIAESYREQTKKSYAEIFKENIYGLDIANYSICRTKIFLSLLAILDNEDRLEFEFNLYEGNALSFSWDEVEAIRLNEGFDVIVGNPPYVGASKIDKKTKALLKTWSVAKLGKSDLYIPFFEIGVECLNPNGLLGFITVNTFLKSLNGRLLRSYFSRNRLSISIIDFGGEQLFRRRSTYTCICLIGKCTSDSVRYLRKKSTEIGLIEEKNFLQRSYSDLDDVKGWYLVRPTIQQAIQKIENTGQPLGTKFSIRNGFATLKNSVYVFKKSRETKRFFYFKENGVEIKIEKAICRKAIKPNTLKADSNIEENTEQLIFPYLLKTPENNQRRLFSNQEKVLKVIKEKDFQTKFPFAYKYLLSHKETLAKRDKGAREYDAWYAFGRTQALTLYGNKLLFPYISGAPCFVITNEKDLLFYNGYAVFSDSERELMILKKILMSKIFWFYIKNTSKPYSSNYFALSKSYIKNFGVCELSTTEENALIGMNSEKVDLFLCSKYGLDKSILVL